jgi:hypothetical protein
MRYPFELWDTDCVRHGLIDTGWKLSLDIAARIEGKTGHEYLASLYNRERERRREGSLKSPNFLYVLFVIFITFVRL